MQTRLLSIDQRGQSILGRVPCRTKVKCKVEDLIKGKERVGVWIGGIDRDRRGAQRKHEELRNFEWVQNWNRVKFGKESTVQEVKSC